MEDIKHGYQNSSENSTLLPSPAVRFHFVDNRRQRMAVRTQGFSPDQKRKTKLGQDLSNGRGRKQAQDMHVFMKAMTSSADFRSRTCDIWKRVQKSMQWMM